MTRLERGVRDTFSALAVRNFRLLFAGQVVSVTGTWMQMIAQSWLVLTLTGSAAVLGLVTALQFLPTLLLGPYAGVVADRVDKRRLLLVTQTLSGTLAITLGVLVATDVVQIWMVFVLAGALGLVGAVDMPARQSFTIEVVGPERLTNALSLNTITMNVGRLFGPAVAGLVISGWDLSVCFLANGLSFLAPTAALLAMRRDELNPTTPVPRAKGQLRDGLRYVWATPALRVPLLLMLVVGTLTYEFQVSLPVLARETFGVGAAGFGLLQSAMSIGAIVGGLLFATRATPTHRRMGLAAAGFGAVVLLLAVAPTYLSALMILPLVGAGSVLFLTLANSTLQLTADPQMRSRVIALYTVAFIGSTPIGGPIIGWIAQSFGARWALAVGGAAALLGAALAWRSLRHQTTGTGRAAAPVVDPTDGLVQAPSPA
ncbi:MAG: MFS transporter [Acidimicrobiales bacterium]|nr:MFS transporter [Acidimicrobiales bacterium]